jgi:hypothetical protein
MDTKPIQIIDPLNYLKGNNHIDKEKDISRASNFIKRKSKSKP